MFASSLATNPQSWLRRPWTPCEQGVALVNLGSERYVPAAIITGAEVFTKEDADRLKGEDHTHKSITVGNLAALMRRSTMRRSRSMISASTSRSS